MSEDKLLNSCEGSDSKLTRLGSKLLSKDDSKTMTASVDSDSYRSKLNESSIALAKQMSVCSTEEEKDYFEVPATSFQTNSINSKFGGRERKILGVDEEEMKRNKALISLGVTHSDAIEASKIMKSLPTPKFTKEEKLMGYTISQIKRQKALELLGSTEEMLADDIARTLSSMGVRILDHGSRRRSVGQPLRRGLSVPVFGSLATEFRKNRTKESPDVSLYGAHSSTQSSQRSKV